MQTQFITVIFGLTMIGFWAGNFFLVYHLSKFGTGKLSEYFSFFFLAGSILLTATAFFLYFTII